MNSTVSENRTFFLDYSCTDTELGYLLHLSVMALDFTVLLPIHIWVLWLGISGVRIRGRLAASEIFTMNLTALEVFAIVFYSITMLNVFLKYENRIFVIFFSGSYMVGRPAMNSLICVERYMAVARPVIYLDPAHVKHRYAFAALVWLAVLAYGGISVATYPRPAIEVFVLSLTISLLVITSCSLGMLKILLKPSPGETQKEGMHRQKKRAFVIVTGILVSVSVPSALELIMFVMAKCLTNNTFCLILYLNLWVMRPSSVIQPVLYLSKNKKLPFSRKN